MKILGISAFYHDAAAALLIDGRIVAAAQEERFTRIKNDAAFPSQAIDYCLRAGRLNIDDLDAVVFYDKPFLKFERLLETYLHYAPAGLLSFCRAIPVWIQEKLLIKSRIRSGLSGIQSYKKKKLKILFTAHHLARAASAFFASPYQKATIVTIDGVGEWHTASIGLGDGNRIELLRTLSFPDSVGLLYSSFTYFLGFRVNSGEYKLMGLAPFGRPQAKETADFIHLIKTHLVSVCEDGSIRLNMKFFSFATGLRMIPGRKWEKLFNLRMLRPGEEPSQAHCDLALAIQTVTEEIILNMVRHAIKLTGVSSLCMAGGVALNCVANGKILSEGLTRELFVQPAAGDAGGALGAALAAHFMYFGAQRNADGVHDLMQGSYLGPDIASHELPDLERMYKARYEVVADEETLIRRVADLLAQSKVVGWVQDRMEFGPRALGNRSILAHAGDDSMQRTLNLKIKYREGFRPFAPSVCEEDLEKYFVNGTASPYMLTVAEWQPVHLKTLPGDFSEKTVLDKLYAPRSVFQPVTHVDRSARAHSVSRSTNPRFWALLRAFEAISGHPVLINTSFNVRGEPIVCSAQDAYLCFMNTGMDVLVIGPCIFYKEQQQRYDDREFWKMKFKED